jgi:cysteine-rich repeat protein
MATGSTQRDREAGIPPPWSALRPPLAAGLALALVPTLAFAQLSTGQQGCVNEFNKNLEKVAKTQAKDAELCIRNGSKGKTDNLGPGATIEACLTNDVRGKVATAKEATVEKTARKCGSAPPPFGATDAATVNHAAMDAPLMLVHQILDMDLDTVILPRSGATVDGAKCQQAIVKRALGCLDTTLAEFNRCKKNGLAGKGPPDVPAGVDVPFDGSGDLGRCLGFDAKDRVAAACARIARDIDTKCVGKMVDLPAVFPACGGDDGETLDACVRTRTTCRACLALTTGDLLLEDCDLVDDAAGNGSCEAVCGNTLRESSEECDDGNTADGDGCDAVCRVELPRTLSLVNLNILQDISPGNVGFDDLRDRLTLLANQLAVVRPDIVTLQEVTTGFQGAATILVDDLQDRFGLSYFAAEYGIAAGNAVLSRWPVTLKETERIPDAAAFPGFPDPRFTGRVEVRSPVGPIDVYAMHLCAFCGSAERAAQAEVFADFVTTTHVSAHPAIIGADFNAHKGSPPDADPVNGAAMDVLEGAGWTTLFDGFDAPCDPPADRSGCTSGIDDLTVPVDTTTHRIDNVMTAPASVIGSLPPLSVAVELGPTRRFADVPYTDPGPECHFDPRLPCTDDTDCPPGTGCNRNDLCVRQTPISCVTDADCPNDIAPESCRTTLWVSDHVGVTTIVELRRLPPALP